MAGTCDFERPVHESDVVVRIIERSLDDRVRTDVLSSVTPDASGERCLKRVGVAKRSAGEREGQVGIRIRRIVRILLRCIICGEGDVPLVDRQIRRDVGDVVLTCVRTDDRSSLNLVGALIITRGTAECARQRFAGRECTRGDGVRQGWIIVAVILALRICSHGDLTRRNGDGRGRRADFKVVGALRLRRRHLAGRPGHTR